MFLVRGYSNLLSVAGINTMSNNNLGEERAYFSLYFQVITHHWQKSVQGLKQKSLRMLLSCSLSGSVPALGSTDFLIWAQGHLPRGGTDHSKWIPSIQIISQDNAHTDRPTDQSDRSCVVNCVCHKFIHVYPVIVFIQKIVFTALLFIYQILYSNTSRSFHSFFYKIPWALNDVTA